MPLRTVEISETTIQPVTLPPLPPQPQLSLLILLLFSNIILENVISVFWDNFRTIGRVRKMELVETINGRKKTEDTGRLTATLDSSHTKAHRPKTFRAPPYIAPLELAPPIPLPRS